MVCYPQNGGTIVLKMVVFVVVVDCFSMNYNLRQINNYKTKIKQLKNTQHMVFSSFTVMRRAKNVHRVFLSE